MPTGSCLSRCGSATVSRQLSAQPRSSHSRLFIQVNKHSPWAPAFSELVEILSSASAVARLARWAAAEGAAGPERLYRARALLAIAAYERFWLGGKPCPALLELLATEGGRAPLKVTALEAKIYSLLASGPQPCGYVANSYTCDLPFLFSSEGTDASVDTIDRANERSFFITALAVVLGLPPEQNYYHMAAFEPRMFDTDHPGRTAGLGSGLSDYAKDCGYIMM